MNLLNSNPSRPVILGCAMVALLSVTACGKRDAGPAAAASTPPAAAAAQALRPLADASLTRQQLENGPLEPACSLENVVDMSNERPVANANAVYTVARDKVVKLIGFSTVKSKGEAMGAFTAYLAGAAAVYKVAGHTELDRPDVVTFFNNTAGLLKSGFQIDADLREIPAGEYAVYLLKTGGAVCPTHYTIRIQ